MTFVLDGMKPSIAHRKVKGKEKGKQAGSKPPRKLVPADATVYTREDGPTVQLCGGSEVGGWQVDKRQELFGTEVSRKIGLIQKTLHHWWKKEIANPLSKIDDYVKHIFWEHNKEVDHWANVGAEGQRKVVSDRKSDADTWKAVEGFWDGSCEDNGKSGCGVVIKGVDRERWLTISRIAIPLKVGTAMVAEMMGVRVLTGILDLVFHQCPYVQNINQCI